MAKKKRRKPKTKSKKKGILHHAKKHKHIIIPVITWLIPSPIK